MQREESRLKLTFKCWKKIMYSTKRSNQRLVAVFLNCVSIDSLNSTRHRLVLDKAVQLHRRGLFKQVPRLLFE